MFREIVGTALFAFCTMPLILLGIENLDYLGFGVICLLHTTVLFDKYLKENVKIWVVAITFLTLMSILIYKIVNGFDVLTLFFIAQMLFLVGLGNGKNNKSQQSV